MPTTLLNVAAKSVAGSNETVRAALAHVPSAETNVGGLERLVSAVVGGGLMAWSLTGRRTSLLGAAAGGAFLFRGLSGNCALYKALGVCTTGGGSESVIPAGHGLKVEHAVTINRPVAEVYRFWRGFENLPRFMSHLVEVKDHGGNRSHWVAKGPLGLRVEWDAEIVTDTPNEVIAWKSVGNADVDTAGSVHFREAGGGTEVRVSLKYDPPGGKLGAAAARLFGEAPEQQVVEDLRRLKELLERSGTGA